MSTSIVIVDGEGFAGAAGKLAGVALGLQPLAAEIHGLAGRASGLDLAGAAATIERLVAPVQNVRVTLETLSVAFRERARWARLAAENPNVRRWLDHIMNSRNGMTFLLSSALGGQAAIGRLAVMSGPTSQDPLSSVTVLDVIALRGLAEARGSSRFAAVSRLVEQQVTYAALRTLDTLPKGWGTQQLVSRLDGKASLSLEAIADLVDKMNQRRAAAGAFGQFQRVATIHSIFDIMEGKNPGAAVGGASAAGAVLDGLLKYWQDGPNPLLTPEERYQRAAATAATSFAVGGAASAIAIVACGVAGVATAGAGLVACGLAGGLVGGIVGGKVFGDKIDEKYDGNKTEEQFHKDREHDRKGLYESHLKEYLKEKKNVEFRMTEQARWMKDGDWSPQRQREFDGYLNKISKQYFYERYGYPARDAIDRKLLEEQDRTAWHRANIEFKL